MADLIEDDQFLEQYQRAVAAANQASTTEPRAVAAYYDDESHLIVIRLNSGSVFCFPPDIAQGLAGASKDDLAAVEITPSGTGLHWENRLFRPNYAGLRPRRSKTLSYQCL